MARSPEYPDLPWQPPRSFTRGRAAGPPRVIVVHTTEGHEHEQAAEDGASYDTRRTDGTSAHYYVDPDSIIQCVKTTDTAHTARYNGNRIGIHYELCGRAEQSVKQWDDTASTAIVRRAARQAARDARKYAIPVVKLTANQVRAGNKGICGHADITQAYPEDNGTHWDPGPHFPWQHFLALVRGELTGKADDDMDLTDPVRLRTGGDVTYSDSTTTVEGVLTSTNYYVLQSRNKVLAELSAIRAGQTAIIAAMEGLDTATVLALIEQHASEAVGHAALRDVVNQVANGTLAASDGVRMIGEKLAAPKA